MPLFNPYGYRKFPIILIDIVVIGVLIYAFFQDDDFNGLARVLSILTLVILLLFNIYAWLLWAIFKKFYSTGSPRWHIETLYIVLLVFPLALVNLWIRSFR